MLGETLDHMDTSTAVHDLAVFDAGSNDKEQCAAICCEDGLYMLPLQA
jgi:hypothetical protein